MESKLPRFAELKEKIEKRQTLPQIFLLLYHRSAHWNLECSTGDVGPAMFAQMMNLG